jgi:hypothetical protein
MLPKFHREVSDLPVGCGSAGRTVTEGEGEVEAVVLMRGEVRLDRDAAFFDVSLHA